MSGLVSFRAGLLLTSLSGLVLGAGLWLWSVAGGEVYAAMLLGAVLRCL